MSGVKLTKSILAVSILGGVLSFNVSASDQKCSLNIFSDDHRREVYSPKPIELEILNEERSDVAWQDILIRANKSDTGLNQPCRNGDSCYGTKGSYRYKRKSVRDAFNRVLAIEGQRTHITERGVDSSGWEMDSIETTQCSWNIQSQALTCKVFCTLWQED